MPTFCLEVAPWQGPFRGRGENPFKHEVRIFVTEQKQESQCSEFIYYWLEEAFLAGTATEVGVGWGWGALRLLGPCSHTGQASDRAPQCPWCSCAQESCCCAVSDMIVHLWAVQPLASFIVWNVLILLPIFKLGNVSPLPALFLIVLPSLFLASLSSWACHPHPLLTAFPFFLTLLAVFASLPSSASQLSKEKEENRKIL